jgi:tetratricopeptide (TPR) repeat protein
LKPVARWAAVGACALACGWMLARWAYPPVACNRELTAVTRRTGLAEKTQDIRERFERARTNVADLRRIQGRCGMDTRLYVMLATNQEILGFDEDALRSYDEALTIDRRPEIYFARGYLLLRLGRFEASAQSYATGVRFNENNIDNLPSDVVRTRVEEILREKP